MKVLIVGSNGFLGSHVKSIINNEYDYEVLQITGKEQIDITKYDDLDKYLSKSRPDVVINCAAFVGGISYGYKYPARMLYENSMMAINLYKASQKNKVKMAIAVWEWGAYYGDAKIKGAKLDISKWNRPSPETIPSFAKAAGLYMICSMSKHSAEAKGCSDSLMRDYRGYVAEATGANIFFFKNGEVHTPLPDCFLNGITRQTIINIIKKNGFKVFERHIEINELENFEQCWLTGTAAEVTPVGQIGDYNFEVGSFVKDLVTDYENIVRE